MNTITSPNSGPSGLPSRLIAPPEQMRLLSDHRLADSPQDAFEIKLCLGHRREKDTSGGLRIFQSIVRLEFVANPPAHIREPSPCFRAHSAQVRRAIIAE